MNTEPLKQLGLTEGEIKVYSALVKLGETTTGPIVKHSTVSVSKVYIILDKLAEKGLVSHILKNKTKYFTASSPERLLVYLQEKQQFLQSQESELKKIIPEFEVQKSLAPTSETVQVFDGLKGIQTARERTLQIMKKGDEMWILGIAKTPYDRLTPFFAEYHSRRYKKGIICNYLYNEYARDPHGELSATYPLSNVRYMPEGLITHAWMEIYADTVTIGINKGKSFSVVIQNQEVAESFKIYAKILWSIAHN